VCARAKDAGPGTLQRISAMQTARAVPFGNSLSSKRRAHIIVHSALAAFLLS
jgi:hypothetical protein